MKKRMTLMLIAVTAVLGVLGAVKVQQIRTAMAGFASFQPPPEAVTTIVARQDHWPATIDAIGTLTAARGVTVSADLPGLVESIAFESGQNVAEGAVLAQLDTRQEMAQLSAAEAQLHLSATNLDRMRGLKEERVVSQAEFDQAEAAQKQAEAAVGEIRATIARKTIRAPFAGVLGIRQINLGQYVTGGAPIVSLQSLNPIYVDFSVPQEQLARLRTGTEVRVTAENSPAEIAGTVTALDSVVDQATRNVQVRATLPNPGGALRPGMFVQARVTVGSGQNVVALPASAINYAPYGDSVFIVTDMKNPKGVTYRGVLQRFVKLGSARGDQIAIVSGVQPGDEVVTSGVFKLRNGAAVLVDNRVQPSNKPTPRPEES
jgi:membrane fusion protein (multidrug efflux system)